MSVDIKPVEYVEIRMDELVQEPRATIKVQETCTVEYWGAKTEIPKGKITKKVEAVFTMGQCHALALALHEETGWPLAGTFRIGVDLDDDNEVIYAPNGTIQRTPSHVVVLSPYGPVDIKGISDSFQGIERIIPISKEHVMHFKEIDYLEPNLAVAQEYVKPVLRKVKRQVQAKKRREQNQNTKGTFNA